MLETAVLIRSRNEERWIGTLLQTLQDQTYKDFEIILVDNGSTDRTLEIANRFPIKIVNVPDQEFSYPHALNVGMRNSSATKYIAIISAHAFPYSKTWLEDGVRELENNPQAAGIYGPQLPLPGATLADRIFVSRSYREMKEVGGKYIVRESGMGVLGFTNAMIRKELWEAHPFNDTYGLGGEDGEWAGYWLNRGWVLLKDIKFTVYHSHNLGFWGWWRQRKYWSSLGRPHPFKRLSYRKDAPHRNS